MCFASLLIISVAKQQRSRTGESVASITVMHVDISLTTLASDTHKLPTVSPAACPTCSYRGNHLAAYCHSSISRPLNALPSPTCLVVAHDIH